ncbi:MAG: DNA mismatch repair endonuclease MutL [Candidatus Binatia bacterium]
MKISLLPETLASRIAAGEVVERPASVVKELVENSLDACAKEISIWVEGGGISLIRVSDDGEGIAFEDMPLAVERHATSKLKDEDGLFRISTLGFRGEALPSIASVCRLEILSRTRREEVGCRLRMEGGKKVEPVMAGCPAGTTVEVRDLFFNIPVRRKFLRSPSTELSHLCDVVNRMALAHSGVHFRLHHGGRALCNHVGGSRLEDRLQQVLGADIAGGMASFSWSKGRVGISGFLSTTPNSFPNSRYLLTYVNRRFVRDRMLTHAILEGYDTLLMKGRYPAVVLYLEIPFEEVDVNVHPAKYEVRFRQQSEVHDRVVQAVRDGLKRDAKGPAPRTAREKGQAFVGVREGRSPYGPFSPEIGLPFSRSDSAEGEPGRWEFRKGFFSSLEILGQLLGCYIVCGSPHGMALIDQHAAHERIAFEKMRLQLDEGRVESQDLLIPQVLELSVSDASHLGQRLSTMDRLGFTIEGFGPNSFAVKAVPAPLPPGDFSETVRRMVSELAEVDRSTELKRGLEERLMTIACHSVIRANRKLSVEEIRALLGELDEIEFATQCPHGRPVLIELSQSELERMFKRA